MCSNNCLIQLHPVLFSEGPSVTHLCLHQILCSRGVHWLLTKDPISCIFLVAIACSWVTASTFFPLWQLQQKVSLSLSLTWPSDQLCAPLRPNTSHLPILPHSTRWSADTRSTLPALLGHLKQKSSLKLLGSCLGWETEPEQLQPFLCKKRRGPWNEIFLDKDWVKLQEWHFVKTSKLSWVPTQHFEPVLQQQVVKVGERVGGKWALGVPPSWGHMPLPYEKDAQPCAQLPSY